jgi:hypothetical protein
MAILESFRHPFFYLKMIFLIYNKAMFPQLPIEIIENILAYTDLDEIELN